MRARLRLLAAGTVALGAVAASPRAQNAQTTPASQTAPAAPTPQAPDSQQQPTFRTGVDVVTVDVGVVDSRGNPVEDLRAPDFGVKIDGQVRRVVSAELIKADVAAARRQA